MHSNLVNLIEFGVVHFPGCLLCWWWSETSFFTLTQRQSCHMMVKNKWKLLCNIFTHANEHLMVQSSIQQKTVNRSYFIVASRTASFELWYSYIHHRLLPLSFPNNSVFSLLKACFSSAVKIMFIRPLFLVFLLCPAVPYNHNQCLLKSCSV